MKRLSFFYPIRTIEAIFQGNHQIHSFIFVSIYKFILKYIFIILFIAAFMVASVTSAQQTVTYKGRTFTILTFVDDAMEKMINYGIENPHQVMKDLNLVDTHTYYGHVLNTELSKEDSAVFYGFAFPHIAECLINDVFEHCNDSLYHLECIFLADCRQTGNLDKYIYNDFHKFMYDTYIIDKGYEEDFGHRKILLGALPVHVETNRLASLTVSYNGNAMNLISIW